LAISQPDDLAGLVMRERPANIRDGFSYASPASIATPRTMDKLVAPHFYWLHHTHFLPLAALSIVER